MSPEQQNYLKEHLPYTLRMLRHTHQYLVENPSGLDWNVYFEAFSVHARNFDRFLTNNNPGNFKSSEFANGYKHQNRKLAAEAIFQKIEYQVFHFGKRRPTEHSKKVDIVQIDRVFKWLEIEITKFYDCLSDEHRSLWDLRIADPHKETNGSVNLSGRPSRTTSVPSAGIVIRPPF